jgi:hypothetical protein
MIMTIFLKTDKVKKALKMFIYPAAPKKHIKFSWDYPFKRHRMHLCIRCKWPRMHFNKFEYLREFEFIFENALAP